LPFCPHLTRTGFSIFVFFPFSLPLCAFFHFPAEGEGYGFSQRSCSLSQVDLPAFALTGRETESFLCAPSFSPPTHQVLDFYPMPPPPPPERGRENNFCGPPSGSVILIFSFTGFFSCFFPFLPPFAGQSLFPCPGLPLPWCVYFLPRPCGFFIFPPKPLLPLVGLGSFPSSGFHFRSPHTLLGRSISRLVKSRGFFFLTGKPLTVCSVSFHELFFAVFSADFCSHPQRAGVALFQPASSPGCYFFGVHAFFFRFISFPPLTYHHPK